MIFGSHFSGGDTCEITRLIVLAEVSAHILSCLIAGSMEEFHVGEFISYIEGEIHISEACGEYDVVGLCQFSNDALCIGTFRNVFNEVRFDAELFFHVQTALVMLIRVTAVARRPDVDKSNRRLLCCRLRCCRCLCCSPCSPCIRRSRRLRCSRVRRSSVVVSSAARQHYCKQEHKH
ncbi:hypothetical protein D3C80_1172050 [compost metagenome]